MNTSPLVDELNRQYQITITLAEKAFFVGVANYVRSILGDPELVSLRANLSQKALVDYDKVLETINSHKPNQSDHKKWEFADFIEAARALGEKNRAIDNLSLKEQVETSHAWMRLQSLEMLIHDPEKAERIYSKTSRGKREYELASNELGVIFSTKGNERDNAEYDFWVGSGIKNGLSEVPRSIFVKDEYLNYFTQVHTYFVNQLSKNKTSTTIIFPEGQTVIYRNGILSFSLGDGTHDSIDFSTAPKLMKVFDVFWENKKRINENNISSSKALNLYHELHNQEIETRQFGYLVSHIRSTKINKKRLLKERIKIDFDHETNSWHYEWH